MQKLFSMFPRGAPGFALLLLRLYAGAVLVAAAATAPGVVSSSLLIASALAICVGVATPIAALVAGVIESISLHEQISQTVLPALAPIVITVALAMLGPGAYSIDARLFGRRLLDLGTDGDIQD